MKILTEWEVPIFLPIFDGERQVLAGTVDRLAEKKMVVELSYPASMGTAGQVLEFMV